MIEISFTNRPPQESTLERSRLAYAQFRKRRDIGFSELPQRDHLWMQCRQRAGEIHSAAHVVVVGIGGSSLGGRVLAQLCDQNRVHFLENVDFSTVSRLIVKLGDFGSCHFVWISKSGGTIEMMAHLHTLVEMARVKGHDLTKQSTVVTGLGGGALFNWASENQIPILEVPKDVGGRFSVLSPVGILPAELMGLDVRAIRRGASWALTQDELVINLMAICFESWQRSEWVTLFWAYADHLKEFGLWSQQLWAESLAKKVTRGGDRASRVSFPVGCVGTNDQHSILQQVVEGFRDKLIWFTRVKTLEGAGPKMNSGVIAGCDWVSKKRMGDVLAAEAEGTCRSLEEQDVSFLVWTWAGLNEEVVGAGLMLKQLLIAGLGEMLDINAFDQPGVEQGKTVALELLRK